MDRREFLMGMGAAAWATAAANAESPPKRPNFLFLFSDDHRWDAAGCMGNPVIETPELDRLAAGGVLFKNAFVTISICCVSRASTLTGQYARRHGVHDFFTPLPPESLAQGYSAQLREYGYYTGFIGKWGIGDSVERTAEGAKYFDYWAGASHQTNFWHEADCPYVTNDGIHQPTDNTCTCPADARGVAGPGIRIGKKNIENPVHLSTEIIPAKAQQFLETRDPDKPFCLSIFWKAPHSPWTDWDPSLAGLYEDAAMPVPKSATPERAEDRPDFLKQSLAGPVGQRWADDHDALQDQMRHYYRLITTMDRGIGKVRALLEGMGLADNTVILYTSDNGHFLGDHGYAGKWLMHEESIRVPMIAYDPRLPAGRRGVTSNAMTLNIDMAPTMLDLAGAPIPDSMQGESIAPLMRRDNAPWRKQWFYEHLYEHGGQIVPCVGVRSERWKYIRYYQEDPVYESLYDLENDPDEVHDLAREPAHAERLEKMRARCAAYEASLR